MSDIALCREYEPGPDWEEVVHCGKWSLFAKICEVGHEIEICTLGGAVLVLLGDVREREKIERWALRGASPEALDEALGGAVCGAVVTGRAFCVFRDKLGLIPMVRVERGKRVIITSSPEAVNEACCGAQLSESWTVHYLRGEFGAWAQDVYEGQTRFLPGTCFVWHDGRGRTVRYWPRRDFFEPLCVHEEEGTERVRGAFVRAVRRIPKTKPRVYTLSGGLDSGGIVGVSCKALGPGQRLKTVSLTSRAFASSDESAQLDVLESALPIDSVRLCMDDTPSLSKPELYAFDAFGPQLMPGVEVTHSLFVHAAQSNARLVVGGGGNNLVLTRDETLLLDLMRRRDIASLSDELGHLSRSDAHSLVRRVFRGAFAGKLRTALKTNLPAPLSRRLFAQIRPEEALGTWLTPHACRAYPFVRFESSLGPDLAHLRLNAVMSWQNELYMRSLDRLGRKTGAMICDPLYDPELFELCARMPARFWLHNGVERPVYRAALAPFLPFEILDHPKVQSFTAPTLSGAAAPAVESWFGRAVASKRGSRLERFVCFDALLAAFERFQQAERRGEDVSFVAFCALWQAFSLCL